MSLPQRTVTVGLGRLHFGPSSISKYRSVPDSDYLFTGAPTSFMAIPTIAVGLVTRVIGASLLGYEGRGFFPVAGTLVELDLQSGSCNFSSAKSFLAGPNPKTSSDLMRHSLAVSFGGSGHIGISSVLKRQ
jgi:hypothetical protein